MSKLSISFGEGAEEAFADRISNIKGWGVRLTPQDGGKAIEAVIYGSGIESGSEWYDAVAFQYSDENGEAIIERGVEIIRVSDVHIY